MADHSIALEADIAEIARLADWIEASCSAEGIGDAFAAKLALVLDEAVANVIHHGFAGVPPPHRIEVRLEVDAERVTALVIDNGHPFDPCVVPSPDCTLPLEERNPGGLGIHLIHRMMDRVEYRRVAGENRLRLEKSLT
jgi:anti-sigma regulatory factor (Ser/Thr protein kinase)